MSPNGQHGVVLPVLIVVVAGYMLLHSGLTATAQATPAAVQSWIHQADQILVANGTPASALNPADVALIIRYESSNDPTAINRTDSNAAAGNPSVGLMQTTGTTFRANALPGHNDITNPVDNIIAGERYALRRYGSLDNVPGVRAVHAGSGYVPY